MPRMNMCRFFESVMLSDFSFSSSCSLGVSWAVCAGFAAACVCGAAACGAALVWAAWAVAPCCAAHASAAAVNVSNAKNLFMKSIL